MATLDGLQPEFRQRLELMLAEGGAAFTLNYGFRSRAEQTRLYNLYLAGKGSPANKPGTSKHELGEAADVACDAKHDQLRADLAKKFGFLQPYFKTEPWHLELDPDRKPLSSSQSPVQPTTQETDDNMADALTIEYNGGVQKTGTDPTGGVFNAGTPFYGSMYDLAPEEKQGFQSIRMITKVSQDPADGYVLHSQNGGVYLFDREFTKTHKV